VIFSPSAVYFAFSRTVSSNLIGKIDIDLSMLKADPTSVYYALADKWLKPRFAESAPAWVYWLVAGLGVMLAGSLAAASYMRYRIAEGTAQLRAAMEEATAANRSKSAFLANMSHDLRTPLNSILGFSEAMQRQLFGPLGDHRYVDYVGNIHRSGQHLIALVNDILDLSKIECGKYEIAETWVDVSGELAEAKTRIAAAGDAGSRIQVTAGAGELFADRRAVIQIIDNLLSNAVKHAGDGAAITAGWIVGSDGTGDLFVADSGKGIPEAELPRIAEPFFQGSGDRAQKPLTARNAAGIGLGLSIVSQLARIHDAVLAIESTVGKGSTFTVRFPAQRLDRRHNQPERRQRQNPVGAAAGL
jgi:signal transduction histidine kinase